MSIGIWQIVIVALLLVLLFGRGKISDLMGDVAKGIKSFKKGMAEEVDEKKNVIDHQTGETISPHQTSEKSTMKQP